MTICWNFYWCKGKIFFEKGDATEKMAKLIWLYLSQYLMKWAHFFCKVAGMCCSFILSGQKLTLHLENSQFSTNMQFSVMFVCLFVNVVDWCRSHYWIPHLICAMEQAPQIDRFCVGLPVRVCVHLHVCICTRICVYGTHMRVRTRVHIHACMCTHTYLYL